MEYVLTAAEMKQCDEQTTTEYGIPSLVLMERAALETARIITGRYGTDISVGIVAGSGNNGGDGIAIARILQESGVSVQIHLIGEEAKCTEQTRMHPDIILDVPDYPPIYGACIMCCIMCGIDTKQVEEHFMMSYDSCQ